MDTRKTIGWIEISLRKQGAIVYNEQARDMVSGNFDVELVDMQAKHLKRFRYLKIPESLLRLSRLKGEKDIWIRDFYSVLTLPFDRTQGKNVAIMHHLDFSGFPLVSQPVFFVLTKLFFRNLKKIDAIVVVSQFWKEYFGNKGYSNIHVIYNGFDSASFEIPAQEVQEFKERYGLQGKPIIYLGNCQRPKGVVEAYHALKHLPVHLVTSGRQEVKLPVRNFQVRYREYLTLLKASCVALAMSKLKEGWCRTAHEAMLVKTPVIGSGIAGMRELLEGGRQIICEDFRDLKGKVEFLLTNPQIQEKRGEEGHLFAKEFTLEKFGNAWISLLKNL
ncbi:MAG: glycosyltransferase family 4 protein [Patescibacteria group bacterium]